MTITGLKIPFGVCEKKIIVGAPAGKVRIKMRTQSPVRVYVKSNDGTLCFIPIISGETWKFRDEMVIERNIR